MFKNCQTYTEVIPKCIENKRKSFQKSVPETKSTFYKYVTIIMYNMFLD